MFISLLIMIFGMLVIGNFISQQIETGVINQTSAVTALYVDSFISPNLQSLAYEDELDRSHLTELDRLIHETSLGQQIVSYKIWSPEGRIIYSPNKDLMGHYFENDKQFLTALSGQVSSEISNLDQPEHEYERQTWSQLIETYAPVMSDNDGKIIAVSEFYQLPDNLESQIKSAQLQSWLVVGIATFIMYILLTGIFGRASNTIINQQAQLNEKVLQLTGLLSQNELLHSRVQRAARRTTALNEQFLHRISSDLHDGPIQDIALALLRIESVFEASRESQTPGRGDGFISKDLDLIQKALDSSLKEIRAISSGLRLPELEEFTPEEVIRCAVHNYQRKTQSTVVLTIEDVPEDAPIPVKITLYRVLQEALYNGFQHADGKGQIVKAWGGIEGLQFQVSDSGPGFDLHKVSDNSNFGLAGMRERVEVLGGAFKIKSGNGQSTHIYVTLPIEPKVDL
jgi:signal transduction histidine kinase